MKLKGFGHRESLEVVRSSNGVETIYVPTGTYVDKGNVWSTQLSRFQFKSGATITKMNSSGSFVKRMTITKWKGYEIEGLHLMGDLYATYKTGTNVAKRYKIPM